MQREPNKWHPGKTNKAVGGQSPTWKIPKENKEQMLTTTKPTSGSKAVD